jgi:hypothetical protein
MIDRFKDSKLTSVTEHQLHAFKIISVTFLLSYVSLNRKITPTLRNFFGKV